MRRTWKRAKPKEEKFFRTNREIRAQFVFLIDENGEKVGKIKTEEALKMAEVAELDLIEVSPKDEMPVVKIGNYGQFKYEKEKKAHKQKQQQKKVDIKGVRLSARISKHDFDIRLDQGERFLKKGNKLKIELILKGREKIHLDVAAQIIKDFAADLSKKEGLDLVTEQDLTKMGGRFIMLLANKKD